MAKIVIGMFVGLIGLICVLSELSATPADRANSRAASYCNAYGIAEDQAKAEVTAHLVAPSTASFVKANGDDIVKIGACTFKVTGHVDSQNKFGGTRRAAYVVNTTYDAATGHWETELRDIATL